MACALLALAATLEDASAQAVTLRAVSASGGVVKPERWTSVLVTVDSARASVTGDLLLSWGDAKVRRQLRLASAGRRQFEMYIRASDPTDTIRVVVTGDDPTREPIASADVQVRVLAPDEPFTLCVRTAAGSPPATVCTASVSAELLPASPRGYEAVDEVVVAADARTWSPEQRNAFDRWRALRTLERSGDIGLAPQPSRPSVRRGLSAGVVRPVAGLAVLYATALVVIGWASARRRTRLMATGLWALTATAAASVVAHTAGGIGPRPPVVVHHATVVQQIPGTDVSLLSMRGLLEFPAYHEFEVRLPFRDGAMEAASSAGRTEHTIDADGHPVIRGTFGLGARRAFAAEAFVDGHPVTVTTHGDAIAIVNRSPWTLDDCRFGDAFSVREAASLSPGASLSAVRTSEVLGPVFTCKIDGSPWTLSAQGRTLAASGTTILAVYDSAAGRAASDAGRVSDD
jgi:hypothetical protein